MTSLILYTLLPLLSQYAVTAVSQMTCGPKVSPRLLSNIPCDMSISGYCVTPGSAYPWSSVRRYIHENQGLVKRMYGDQRHSFVLMNEISDIHDKYDKVHLFGRKASISDFPSFSPRSAFFEFDEPSVSSEDVPSPTKLSTTTESVESVTNATSYTSPLGNYSSTSKEEEFTTVTTEVVGDASESDIEFESASEHKVSSNPVEYVSKNSMDTMILSTVSPTTSSSTSQDSGFQSETVEKKGVNACPVKEEVIAPYWANNTRGEVLALLNVYPFEQYVHWEKCAFENSQMFCRQGCRCEQQFRLHRLLAFDPKNECRGIFADWFRFPSCCVCICYDLPESNVFYRIHRRKSRL